MRKQTGFGMIEVLIGMTLLSIATVAMMQIFALQRTSKANVTAGINNLQNQRYLERAIWANYDNHSNAFANCNIADVTQISLDPGSTCINGTSGAAWAEKKELTRSSCTYESYSGSVLSLSNCGANLSILASNINALTNKDEFKILIWAGNLNAQTCTLENSNTPAAISGSLLNLKLSNECIANMDGAVNPAARVPKLAINLYSNGARNDGYRRLYY